MLTIKNLIALNPSIEPLYATTHEKAREYGAVINGKDATAIESAREAAQLAVEQFNAAAIQTAYDHWLAQEIPVKAALEEKQVAQATVKVTEKKKVKGVESNTLHVTINLSDFDQYAAQKGKTIMAGATWLAKMEEARKVFCGTSALDTQNPEDVTTFRKKFDTTFAMNASNTHADCGEKAIDKRYTRNACVRALQEVMDSILFIDETNGGKNKYRVQHSDMGAVLATIAKRGPALHSIVYPNSSAFQRNVTDTLIRIVTNGKYTHEYTTAK